MKPTLFLLAAGMGSRYGGLKQLDGLGPNSETIMAMQRASISARNFFMVSSFELFCTVYRDTLL